MFKLQELDIKNKKVIIRCDFNVPIKNGKITDDTRIVAALETINYCLDNSAKVILLSHLGKVKTEEDLKKNDLSPVAFRLSELLGKKVTFVNETRGAYLEGAIANMQPGEIVLMQNTRYEDLIDKKESKKEVASTDYLMYNEENEPRKGFCHERYERYLYGAADPLHRRREDHLRRRAGDVRADHACGSGGDPAGVSAQQCGFHLRRREVPGYDCLRQIRHQ